MYGFPHGDDDDDEVRKIETRSRCNVLVIKLHITTVHLVG